MSELNQVKSYDPINDIFVELTSIITGKSKDTGEIRKAYLQDSAPFQNIEEDVIYLWARVVPDITNEQVLIDYDTGIISQHSVFAVSWTFYGPNSHGDSLNFKLNLYSDSTRIFLKQHDFAIVAGVMDPVFIMETYNNRNWRRSDLTVYFNHAIESDLGMVDYIEGVNIIIDTETGFHTEIIVQKEE